jgi:hypothetical protein
MASFGHPISVNYGSSIFGQNRSVRVAFLALAILAGLAFSASPIVTAQQPAQAQQSESSSQQKPGSSVTRHGNDFLVRGTVFTPNGLGLPGAELRIRRTTEKKFQWQTVSNSRGDFAVRVKMGADYEVLVRAKGFQEQSLEVDAKTGDRFKDLVFRMHKQESKKS